MGLLREIQDEDIVNPSGIDLYIEYDRLNKQLFHGELPKVNMGWNTRKTAHGVVKSVRNSRTGQVFIRSLEISKFLNITYKHFKNVLAHEMIHVYWLSKGDHKANHGPRFLQQMNRINNMGLGFNVTVKADSSQFTQSTDAIKVGLELVYFIMNLDGALKVAVTNMQGYKTNATQIEDVFKYQVAKRGAYTNVKCDFYVSKNPILQKQRLQRNFNRISYAPITPDAIKMLGETSQYLSTMSISKSSPEPHWSGPNLPNR